MNRKTRSPASLEKLEALYRDRAYPEELQGVDEFVGKVMKALEPEIGRPKGFVLPSFGLWKWAAAAVAAAVIGVAGVFTWFSVSGSPGSGGLLVTALSGQAEIISPQTGKASVLRTGMTVRPGYRVRTSAGTVCDLQVVQKALFRMTSGTEMELLSVRAGLRNSSDIRVNLVSGEIAVKPLPAKSGERFEVITRQMIVGVTGTKFNVVVDRGGETEVAVIEGSVSVRPNLEDPSVEKPVRDYLAGHPYRLRSGEGMRFRRSEVGALLRAVREASVPNSGGGIAQVEIRVNRFYRTSFRKIDVSAWSVRNPLSDDMIIGTTGGTESSQPQRPDGRLSASLLQKAYLDAADPESFASAGHLVAWTEDGDLLIRDARGGAIKKIRPLSEAGLFTRPAPVGDDLVAGSENGGLYLFSGGGSEIARENSAGIMKYGSFPSVTGNRIAVPTIDKGVQIYTREQDRLRLTATVYGTKNKAHYSAPLFIENGRVLVTASEDGTVTAWNVVEGRIVYQKEFEQGRILSPLLGRDDFALLNYFSSGQYCAFDPRSGRLLWTCSSRVSDPESKIPLVLSDRVVLVNNAADRSETDIVNLKDGKRIASVALSRPVAGACVKDSLLYLGQTDGVVRVFRTDGSDTGNVYQLGEPLKYLAVASGEVQAYAVSGIYALKSGE